MVIYLIYLRLTRELRVVIRQPSYSYTLLHVPVELEETRTREAPWQIDQIDHSMYGRL